MKRKARKYQRHGGFHKRCSGHDHERCACPWFFRITVDGQRHRGRIPDAATKTEAREAYGCIAARVRGGQTPFEESSRGPVTIAALGETWLSLPRRRKRSVIASYRDHLRAHIGPALGHVLVKRISPDQCDRFATSLLRRRSDRPLSAGTKTNIVRTLHALLAFAVDRGLRTTNPAAKVADAIDDRTHTRRTAIDPTDATKFFTAAEARHLLATCRDGFPTWHAFVLTGFATGMRLGELRALTYSQIHWQEGTIWVDRAWVMGSETSTKNDKPRSVSMTRELVEVLHLRRHENPEAKLVFPSRIGTPLAISRLRRFWKKLLAAAGLGYRVMHAMRHSHSSFLLHAGHTAEQVAAQAGRTVQVTMDVYAHWPANTSAPHINKLDEMLSGTSV